MTFNGRLFCENTMVQKTEHMVVETQMDMCELKPHLVATS